MAEIQENEELETVELEEEDSGYEVVDDAEEQQASDEDSGQSHEKELRGHSKDVEKRIRQLTAARKQAEEEAAAAMQYIQQVQAENEQMKGRLSNLNNGYMSEYEGRITTQEAQAKRALAEAYEAGDYDKVADAQTAISQIAIEKERLRMEKHRTAQAQRQQVSQAEARALQQKQQAQQPRQAPADPRFEAWKQKNPWFGKGPDNDRVMTNAAQAIHEMVVSEGYNPLTDPDEYYAEIDRRIRQEMPHKFQGNKRVQSVTPASGNSRSPKSGRRKQVELTRGQVAFAKKLGVPLEKYAAEVAKLENRRD